MKPSVLNRTNFIALLVLLLTNACTPLDTYSQNYPSLGINDTSGDYLINPDTILVALNRGDANVFLPMLATPGPNDELLPPGSFEWEQKDYFEIAKVLSQHVWKDDLTDWEVYYVAFGKDCINTTRGFDSFDIIYFKPVKAASEDMYITRQINIYPLAKQVTWGSGSNYPRLFLRDWLSVDLENFKVTADEALQIAEDNGGTDARLRVNNSCNILISSPHNNNNAWSVSYYVRASFQVIVDPYNGKFKVFDKFQ